MPLENTNQTFIQMKYIIKPTLLSIALFLLNGIEASAAIKAGDEEVDVNSTTIIELASAYQTTLKKSTIQTYRWSTTSTNLSITSQSAYSCTIKGLSPGTAQVDYYCSYWIDGYYRTMDFYYTVTVKGGSNPLTISPISITLTYIGEEYEVRATQNGTIGGVYFTSSNTNVVKVSTGNSSGYTTYGTVTAVGSGTAYIYAKNMKGDVSQACTVTVTASKEYQNLSLSSFPTKTYGDKQSRLPSTTDQGLTLTWKSDNSSVAAISGYQLTIKGAGKANLTASNSGDSDYYPFSRTYTLNVDKAPLTITASDCSKSQGEENPELTVTYNGFVNGDDVSALSTLPTVTTTATTNSPAGTYPITVNGASAANYNITYVNGTLTIIENIAETEAIIELSVDGESTYCSNHDLDFSQTNDIRAYIASGYYPQTGSVLLTRVLEVPAGTGIVVKGDAGTYKIPFGTSSAYYLNLLVGNMKPSTIEPTESEYANLFLTDGADGFGFYHLDTPYAIGANSAYLQLPVSLVSNNACSVKIIYEEDADAIHDVKLITPAESIVYDLNGRKLSAPQRGVNIIRYSDGSSKKVLVK